MEKSVWCSLALHFACSCHNCHILMTPPPTPTVPRPPYFLSPSQLLWMTAWIPHIENYFGWCRMYSSGLLFEFPMFTPLPHSLPQRALNKDIALIVTDLRMMICSSFLCHLQTFKVTRFVFKKCMGVVITEEKSCSKKLVTSTPSRYDVRWCS